MENIKVKLKKMLSFLLNPHLVLCFGLAWLVTNGWSYIGAALGAALGWEWLTAISSAYLAMLWFPFTPEKLVTCIIALWLLKRLYPDDQKTLAVLQDLKEKVADKHRQHVEKVRQKKENAVSKDKIADKTGSGAETAGN